MTEQKIRELKKRLPNIRSLAMLKMEKNFIALEKGYPRQPYNYTRQPTSFLIKRIRDELEEMEEAFSKKNVTVMMEECADISNLVDYLFEQLVRFQFQNRSEEGDKK